MSRSCANGTVCTKTVDSCDQKIAPHCPCAEQYDRLHWLPSRACQQDSGGIKAPRPALSCARTSILLSGIAFAPDHRLGCDRSPGGIARGNGILSVCELVAFLAWSKTKAGTLSHSRPLSNHIPFCVTRRQSIHHPASLTVARHRSINGRGRAVRGSCAPNHHPFAEALPIVFPASCGGSSANRRA